MDSGLSESVGHMNANLPSTLGQGRRSQILYFGHGRNASDESFSVFNLSGRRSYLSSMPGHHASDILESGTTGLKHMELFFSQSLMKLHRKFMLLLCIASIKKTRQKAKIRDS